MSDQSHRLNWVDTAKGLSIILVVMMHSAFGVGEETGATGVLHWIIAFATPFRMPEFFLISGLFLAQVITRDWPRFADRRVVHYLYFYAVWALIHIGFKVGLGAGDPALAASSLLLAIIEPYGVLWFIYMLAVMSAAAKLFHMLKVPHWVVLLGATLLQMAPIATPSGILNEFSEYFVFFFAGSVLAPRIFALAAWAQAHAATATLGLLAWAVVNGLLVFSPGFSVLPDHVFMGLAELPGLRLILALSGSLALCVMAALLARIPAMQWLTWLGARSIVVYLAFALPMAITRTVLVKLDLISDTSALSIIVLLAALIAPLILKEIIDRTGWGRFLFERPAWAHLPGTVVARPARPDAVRTPAE